MSYLASIYGKKSLMGYNNYSQTPDSYEQTGRHGAVWGDDLNYTIASTVTQAKDYRYITTLHWHWYFNNDSAWAAQRKTPVNVAAVVTPGTVENSIAISEMSVIADRLQLFKNAGIPVLFRPLHEIDGGWFWWTDKVNPENTVKLYRMMYDYFTNVRGLNNLIWVYNASTGLNVDLAYRAKFYPGSEYVDLASIDVYGIDYRNASTSYQSYFNIMSSVAPNKMLALAEVDACPDPAKMAAGQVPSWLYCLPWWGTPNQNRPVDWAIYEMNHDYMVSLDELPYLGSGSIKPAVGILSPIDDGRARFNDNYPIFQAYASGRGTTVDRVDFLANGVSVGSVSTPPYTFTWSNPTPGLYTIQAKAVASDGASMLSNMINITTGVADISFGQPVFVSSGTGAQNVVDGSFYNSGWISDPNDATPDDEWIYVDLGGVYTINQSRTVWGWKIYPGEYRIDIALDSPENPGSWTTVKSVVDSSPWITWNKVMLDNFSPVSARYLRYRLFKRYGNQTWGGYDLRELTVGYATADARDVNRHPYIVEAASATPAEVWERKAKLSFLAVDPDRDILNYTWSVVSGPSNSINITNNNSIFGGSAEATLYIPGSYILRATATDGRGGEISSDIPVLVHDLNGGYLTDDRSLQTGDGLGVIDGLSSVNRYAMRFILQYGNVKKAVLRVYRRSTDSVPVTMFAYSGASDAWNENSGPVPDKTDLLGSAYSSGGGQWVEIDVTKYVAAEALGDGVATLVLINDQSSWNTGLHSRQNSVNPPELVVTF